MMRSLYSGVSGLKNHQTRMDIIGNNIANVNTTGFKGSRVIFQDMLSQMMQSPAGPTGNIGGVNAQEVGLGVGLASIDIVFTDGNVQSTGKNTDLCLNGNGFFIMANGDQRFYTRNGGFEFDKDGNYTLPGSGLKVQGWMGAGGVINTNGPTQDIVIPAGTTMGATATSNVGISGNLSGDAAIGDKKTVSFSVFDSLGTKHTVTGTLEKKAANATESTWEFMAANLTDTGADVTMANPIEIKFDANGNITGTTTGNLTVTPVLASGTGAVTVTLDFAGMSQYSGESSIATNPDGNASGTLESVRVDKAGTITGTFSNGLRMNLAQVAIATFTNPAGLSTAGSSLYSESNNSGTVQINPAGVGGAGSITPSSVEMSNVNLSDQFSDMIVTQRGFQSNSKIITVSDEMIETLVNMKR